MNRKFDNIMLVAITISFLFVGATIIYFTFGKVLDVNSCNVNNKVYRNGISIDGYEQGSICQCKDGKVVCSKEGTPGSVPEVSDFTRSNLKVTPTYQSVGTKEPLASMPLKTRFTAISKDTDGINISIEQEQKCTQDLRIPVQIGMYYLKDRDLYITNVVNKDKKFTQECIVSVNYEISKVKNINKDFNISYLGEDGTTIKAEICNYQGKIYTQGDVYSAQDNCNICTCSNGISKCSNDRVCVKK